MIIPVSGRNIDRFDALSALVAIVDQGSFAAAARARRSSPPAMTRIVNQLETELGVRLLHRSTRSLRLTSEGEAFVERARRILADLRDAELGARGEGAEPHGILVVTASQLFGRLHVVPLVASLLARHPQLEVRLLLVDRFVNLIEEGVDLAFRIGELPDSSMTGVRLGAVKRVLVSSPDYISRAPKLDTPDDLRKHMIVSFDGLTPTNDWRFGHGRKSSVKVRPRLIVNTAEAAIAAAEAGMGVTQLLSYQVAESVASGRLTRVLQAFEPPAVPVQGIFQPGRGASLNVRAMLDLARSNLAIA